MDQQVYDALAARASGFETPNTVLRRVLELELVREEEKARRRPGALATLLEQGKIEPGDDLVHVQKRKGETFRAKVTADGWVEHERGAFAAPSPALAAWTGSQIDGWAFWTHVPTGKNLRSLRGMREA